MIIRNTIYIILPGVIIGENCFIRAGTVLKKFIKKNSIVEGNPGKVVGLMYEKTIGILNKINYER